MGDEIIKEKKFDRKWLDWSLQGDLEHIGHRILKVAPEKKGEEPLTVFVGTRLHSVVYHHSYGMISRFYTGLLEKKLMGNRCGKCGLIYLPPRAHCWRLECRLARTDWVEMPLEGTIHTYSLLGFSATPFLSGLPFILAYVRVDGANTAIAGRLTGIDPADVVCEMRVKINFIDEPKGSPMDFYFTPLPPVPKSERTPEERARLQRQLDMVSRWVEEKFGGKKK